MFCKQVVTGRIIRANFGAENSESADRRLSLGPPLALLSTHLFGGGRERGGEKITWADRPPAQESGLMKRASRSEKKTWKGSPAPFP